MSFQDGVEPPLALGITAAPPGPRRAIPRVVLVVPVLDEAESLEPFLAACSAAFAGADFTAGFLFVNDGSTDGTREVLDRLAARHPEVTAVHLARNFGKEAALTAGLELVDADAVVPIDVDLQDPPEVIVEFVARWREGYDVVLGRRADRSSDGRLKRWSANGFYRVINAISETDVPNGVGDFRLLDRRVVEVLRQMPERNRFMKGVFSWVGFRTCTVDYVRRSRTAGSSSWSPWRLWNFALDGVTGFSSVPLRIWTYVGLVIAAGCLAFGSFIVVLQLFGRINISGYASLIVAVLFVGSVQLMSLGLLGEYMGRMMTEAKRRPVYIVDEVVPGGGDAEPGEE
ncbi:MAG: glycosyltransferase family 2 protein [Candidatus Nanopelagicales bacterium]|jgi:glycosyltransferase involved in cell wall biosynthesis|nr:glycosyltransferase family 2 protein [Candidatus Nanopelagicales bacterium]